MDKFTSMVLIFAACLFVAVARVDLAQTILLAAIIFRLEK
jgi:hypothetical protein